MRIIVVNVNTSPSMTETIGEGADRVVTFDQPYDAVVLAGFGEHGRDGLQEPGNKLVAWPLSTALGLRAEAAGAGRGTAD
jgi:Asp/Glu/hydantoin racemase